ncbi:Lrp/AsnC family transcriptional regulator [endosymbiont of Ridgeia piscesae]|jgi:DNA-binding Lrp family transcriptional regulator|uniref:siroheme decarboxylase n=1 Tax=endosymbiont of Ridgeia piscesae TaxID=54398 RepID=A0A0T5YTN7_9GAMM|nr:AsnC family transcriptional regulator [endosymbiont of Ridgeia piscesae]KRT53913.1 transcriptional regulator, AsnC family [endosymbiont of Ridgeia piscesae]KRT57704.1 transcriptional regulator, AsnC family [endosymbiont of Ridgeia piscesae]
MDEIDRAIINQLQGGFPLCEHPYREAAARFGISEDELIRRLEQMLEKKQLSRFGPLFNAERLGGGLSLCAMKIPQETFDQVTEQVNAFPEVAHNYARDHQFNMWFVLATETPQRITSVLAEIEAETGYRVYNMPKKEEFFVGLKFEV